MEAHSTWRDLHKRRLTEGQLHISIKIVYFEAILLHANNIKLPNRAVFFVRFSYSFSRACSTLIPSDGRPRFTIFLFSRIKLSATSILNWRSGSYLFHTTPLASVSRQYSRHDCMGSRSMTWKINRWYHFFDRTGIRYSASCESSKLTPPMNWLYDQRQTVDLNMPIRFPVKSLNITDRLDSGIGNE